MERKNNDRTLSIVALLVAVLGLTVGFAAFSTTLNITSNANVPIDDSVWNVGFSTNTSGITSGTVNGMTLSNNNGTLDISQFVISQTNSVNAVLGTTNDSKVEYDFYIVNTGSLDAYLNSVIMGNLTCAYTTGANRTTNNGHTTITNGTGTISDNDCNALFGAKLTIGNVDYESGTTLTSGVGTTNQLVKPNGTPTFLTAKLTIYYKNDSINSIINAPNGDFIVSLSDSTVVYGTHTN